MGLLRVLILLGGLALNAQNSSETGGWSAVLVSCTSAVGYALAAPAACKIVWDNPMDARLQVAACVGAATFAVGQIIDCGCQICKYTGSECAKC